MGHGHVVFNGAGRTKQARVYPEQLCRAMCKGLEEQTTSGSVRLFTPVGVHSSPVIDRNQVRNSVAERHGDPQCEDMLDNAPGEALTPESVKTSRREEIG